MNTTTKGFTVVWCLGLLRRVNAAKWVLLLGLASAATATVWIGSHKKFNLIVITLDTFRADRIGVYGSGRGLTPHLDRFAAEAVLFETTDSTAPLTLPAHASLFTGRFPPGHGVRENADRLGERESGATLAELLARAGFRTGAFVSATVLDASRGLNRGFSQYDAVVPQLDAYGRQRSRRRADTIVARAVQWLDVVNGERFFAWLHFYDTHAPYEPPTPYLHAHGHPYDGAIAFIDTQVGQLLQILERRGLLDQTVIVVVGDHGESLGDHGEWTHGLFVYQSVLHVPLMIRVPGSDLRGRRVAGPTRTVDVMPTVLELLGVHHQVRIDGETLLPLVTGRRSDRHAYSENLYPQFRFGWSSVRALRLGRFKVIDTARPELYDLERDPDERQDLFNRRRDIAERMLATLRQYARISPNPSVARAIDSKTRDQLGALGYVGFAREALPLLPATAAVPDPKDMVAQFNRMTTRHVMHTWRDSRDSVPAAPEAVR